MSVIAALASILAVLALGFSTAQGELPDGDFGSADIPTSSIDLPGFPGSGNFICEFDRYDLEGVGVNITVVGGSVQLHGVAVCGESSVPRDPDTGHLRDFVYVDLSETFTCPTILKVAGVWQYTQFIEDCTAAGSVVGALTVLTTPAPVLLPPSEGGKTEAAFDAACPGWKSGSECKSILGFPTNITDAKLTTDVCGPNGQTLGYSVRDSDGRPGRFQTCTCNGHFGDELECQKVANTFKPLRIDTAGTANCEVVLGKLGQGEAVLNQTGNNKQSVAILESPTCPVSGPNGLDPQSLFICDGAPLQQVTIQTNAGQTYLSAFFFEQACLETLEDVQVGQIRTINFEGGFKDGGRAEGHDTAKIK